MECHREYSSKSHKKGKKEMHDEAHSIALKKALTEIKGICPGVQASFLIDKEGTVIASDTKSPEVPFEKTVKALESLLEKTGAIGGLDSVVINAQKGKVRISWVSDMYLAMITSENVDMNYLQTISRVLILTVMKLLDSITAQSPTVRIPQPKPSVVNPPKPKVEQKKEVEEANVKEVKNETIEEETESPKSPALSPALRLQHGSHQGMQQLVVETIGGFLARGDMVEIDSGVLNQWSAGHNNAPINTVEIQSFSGKSVICKVRPPRDSNKDSTGIIRVPEKTCKDLDVKKGELVRVKPHQQEA
jgi:predicted regulator of Ras-like GTPase activity (Roadblock/LC7/MglB family)